MTLSQFSTPRAPKPPAGATPARCSRHSSESLDAVGPTTATVSGLFVERQDAVLVLQQHRALLCKLTGQCHATDRSR